MSQLVHHSALGTAKSSLLALSLLVDIWHSRADADQPGFLSPVFDVKALALELDTLVGYRLACTGNTTHWRTRMIHEASFRL